ncbi:ABC transporter substrate-binding protein [Methylocystis heyeri]|uniref:Uncharacterized protein n=1 Tax=Methylocystis heyeri TaxID=391905 RepID=A0A6B8KHS6_9HYPH|nr:hypothetical protein [Methylocystis heyeri]QGM46030.1 hypothetical protein H2LOC_010140 [Methylocystis heyeri]
MCGGSASAELAVRTEVLREVHSRETISILDIPANDDTIAGARLGAFDTTTTGKFFGQSFEVLDQILLDGEDIDSAIQFLAYNGVALIVADPSAHHLLSAAGIAKPKNLPLFNVSATDDRLREEDCRSNILHVVPTRSILAVIHQFFRTRHFGRRSSGIEMQAQIDKRIFSAEAPPPG